MQTAKTAQSDEFESVEHVERPSFGLADVPNMSGKKGIEKFRSIRTLEGEMWSTAGA